MAALLHVLRGTGPIEVGSTSLIRQNFAWRSQQLGWWNNHVKTLLSALSPHYGMARGMYNISQVCSRFAKHLDEACFSRVPPKRVWCAAVSYT